MAIFLDSAAHASEKIFEILGSRILLATPLGAGKPNHLINAIYKIAKNDPSYQLTILSALTLEKPKGVSLLEKNFYGPLVERVFKNYPDLDYELDRVAQKIPTNIEVIEFYFPAGKFTKNAYAQRNYISSNYTHVARDLLDRGVNLLVQQVAMREKNGRKEYSFSCNADVTPDVLKAFREKRLKEGHQNLVVVQVNRDLPFMLGDCVFTEEAFDFVIDQPQEYYAVFAPPKAAVGDAEYMIGLYGSTLVKDGGELQIGIGALGDSVAYQLSMRHKQNETYQKLLGDLKVSARFGKEIEKMGSLVPFDKGLFAATEMFVDAFVNLYKAGILKRRVYDDPAIQRLLNEEKITEEITPLTLELLVKCGVVTDSLSLREFNYLVHWGIFREDLKFESGMIFHPDGSSAEAHVSKIESRKFIFQKCLGSMLKNAAVLHGGFFLGPRDFYDFLHGLSDEERSLFQMKSVSRINQLYGHEEIDRLHRVDARFINTCLMMTLLGSAVSDGLQNGHAVSGIGGQYNFVAQAHALPSGRSILNVRAVRGSGQHLHSNIVWNYGHQSIPRHLRDVVITEYGIADIRGKVDKEVIAALINIADSRFQGELLAEAKRHQKIEASYQIPAIHKNNYPETYVEALKKYKSQGLFPRFPYGTDLTADEITLGGALKRLKVKSSQTGLAKLRWLFSALLSPSKSSETQRLLERMSLHEPKNWGEKFYAKILSSEL
jgi:acyl-CoA hydrolase